MTDQYHSVEEIMSLYKNKDALEIIEDMMEKEVIRVLNENVMLKSNSDQDNVGASHAGYVNGIMWVRGELVKIKEALENES